MSRDEIGELANALEVFRQQALEVQRLNLVERLYGEHARGEFGAGTDAGSPGGAGEAGGTW